MAKKNKCRYCGRPYATPSQANECYIKHELIFVPMTKEALNRLAHYIMSGDANVLDEEAVGVIMRYYKHEPEMFRLWMRDDKRDYRQESKED